MASSHLNDHRYKAFADAGYRISVYSPMPSRGISPEIRKKYKYKKKETLYNGKMNVRRFSMFSEGVNPLKRAFRYFYCCTRQFLYAIFLKNVDVMYISSTPPIQGVMAALIKKVKGIPIVYNLQDIFPDSLVGTGLTKKNSLLWKVGRKLEDFTYRNSDKIIVISEDFKKNIIAKGVPESKIEVIYNWVDEDKIVPISRDKNALFDDLDLDRSFFYIVYAGNLGKAQNIDIIIESAAKTVEKQEIKYIIFGSGKQKEILEEKVKKRKLPNIYIFPLQSYEKVSQVYSLGDACIVSCKKGLGKCAMPSKTWSILSTGTPVLASFDSDTELEKLIKNNKLGIFSEAENVDNFVASIMYLYENPNVCEEMSKNARKFVLSNLTRSIGAKKYVDVIDSVFKD
jgi:glycosyltransferase involved in cell wall biosynthesis